MISVFRSSRRRSILAVPLFCFALCAIEKTAASQDAQTAAADEHQPLVSEKINGLSHRMLAAGVKANALAGGDLKPWHIKIDYQVLLPGSSKPVSGTVEEWHAGKYQWRRNFKGGAQGLNGSEWSVSESEQFESKAERQFVGRRLMTLRIVRPVIDPLYQAANIKPEYEMDVMRLKADPLVLNCVSVIDPKRYAEQTNPDWLFPTMCFDSDLHLHLTSAGDTSVQFDDIQPFQGRAVARDVKVLVSGNLNAAMKVTLLENWDGADTSLLKPSKDAVAKAYAVEPGQARPESVYEEGAHFLLRPEGMPTFPPVAVVGIVIQKDGSVKVESDRSFGPNRDTLDAAEIAVSRWKYKPYIVNGQPVEVAYSVVYRFDQPFVPSYAKQNVAPSVVTSPEDYWSAYDPKRDPEKDLAMAGAAAAEGHKRILMEVGGDWCIWCKYLDKFFADHQDVRTLLNANYVVMKVNMSPQNENAAFLGRFPKIPAYPYLFVLDADGKMVAAKKSGDMEECCKTYNASKMKEFLTSSKAQ